MFPFNASISFGADNPVYIFKNANAIIADLEKDYLELSGFEVEIETRGDRGLERALETDYDMYILDLMLPGIDGFEICKKIREVKNTPVLRSASICRRNPLLALVAVIIRGICSSSSFLDFRLLFRKSMNSPNSNNPTLPRLKPC